MVYDRCVSIHSVLEKGMGSFHYEITHLTEIISSMYCHIISDTIFMFIYR